MSIADNIRELRTSHNLTQEEFGKIAGVSAMAISQWENSRAVPRMGAVENIARYFGVSKGTVIDSRDEDSVTLPPGARPLPASKPAYLPFRGKIHAGDPIEADGTEELVSVPWEVAESHPSGFVLQVVGTCMDRVYPENCIVVVDPMLEPHTGDIGAFMVDGEVVMRRVLRGQNTLVLTADSLSGTFDDIVLTGESECITYGRIVWFQPPEEL